jgi:hypothetical protein
MRIRHSVTALALLMILSAISGCKRVTTSVSTTGDIELSRYHTPVITVYEGQVLKFHPSSDSGDITVTFDKGLCEESAPVHGSPAQPARCTVAKQTNRTNPTRYTLTVSGSDGIPYVVIAKPCTGFCH